jgi:DNA-binding MarR family transcriptional regulator
MFSEGATARMLRDAMRPIWRQLTAAGTIPVGKLGALEYPARHGPTTASTLAVAETVSPQAIATAVRELESLDLVTRTPDSRDRRRSWIELPGVGCERLAQERSTGLRWLEYATGTADPQGEKDLGRRRPRPAKN